MTGGIVTVAEISQEPKRRKEKVDTEEMTDVVLEQLYRHK
jgi:hypothetical protein